MVTKDQLLKSIKQESDICKHLFTKIPADQFDYRPAENMRSILELLQYLTFASYEFAMAMINDTFKTNDWANYTKAEKEAKELKPEQFSEAMDKQIENFRKFLDGLSDDDLTNKKVVTGWSLNDTLGANLIDMSLKTITAYRMQLFLYLKMTCAPELHSGNNWSGMD
jgi:uncharacterized damage-inducible protein DinB